MIKFTKKELVKNRTLGERLRKVREEAGFSLTEVEKKIKIRAKYLAALESEDYTVLPGPVYIESFLKKYAEFLQVSSDYVLELYRQQTKRVLPKKQPTDYLMRQKELPRPIITPHLIRRLLIGAVVAAGLFYLGMVVYQIFSPPNLQVISPPDFVTVNQATIEVRGVTEPETQLTINGKRVLLDTTGAFSETITLSEGLNVITISAAKKRSKETVVLRTVRYEIPQE